MPKSITDGRLEVLVDSPAFRYQMQLCSGELLTELQRRCPRARIKSINFTIGSITRSYRNTKEKNQQ